MLELDKIYNMENDMNGLDIPYNMKQYKTIWDKKEGKQKRLHRYTMEQYLGRKLSFNEIVHHMDGNICNNDISNLKLVSRSEHMHKYHPEINQKAIKAKTKYKVDKNKIMELYVNQRLSTEKIEKIIGIPYTTINWFIRKNNIKRPLLFCKFCGRKADYPSRQLCSKCYKKEWYIEHK